MSPFCLIFLRLPSSQHQTKIKSGLVRPRWDQEAQISIAPAGANGEREGVKVG